MKKVTMGVTLQPEVHKWLDHDAQVNGNTSKSARIRFHLMQAMKKDIEYKKENKNG